MRSSLAFVRSTGANDSWQVAGGTGNVQLRSWAGWLFGMLRLCLEGIKLEIAKIIPESGSCQALLS